eukprot:jgi/Galph1/6005/GphlegSOOS_G4699.1
MLRFAPLRSDLKTSPNPSTDDFNVTNKESVFTKLRGKYEQAIQLQADGIYDKASLLYQDIITELKSQGFVEVDSTNEKANNIENISSLQKLPFEKRLFYLCLKNSAYICEEQKEWSQAVEFYFVLVSTFASCICKDTGLVIRILTTLKQIGNYSFARKLCEFFLQRKYDAFIHREWCRLLFTIGDILILDDSMDSMKEKALLEDSIKKKSTGIGKSVSFRKPQMYELEQTILPKAHPQSAFLLVLTGILCTVDSNTYEFLEEFLQTRYELSTSVSGIQDAMGNVIITQQELFDKFRQAYNDVMNAFTKKPHLDDSVKRTPLSIHNKNRWERIRKLSNDLNLPFFAQWSEKWNHSLLAGWKEDCSKWSLENDDDINEFMPDMANTAVSPSSSLIELFCSVLNYLAHKRSLSRHLGPLVTFCWLRVRRHHSVQVEPNCMLDIAELIYEWFPVLCQSTVDNSSTLLRPNFSPSLKSNLSYHPCNLCSSALVECESLLNQFLNTIPLEEAPEKDKEHFVRYLLLRSKLSINLLRIDEISEFIMEQRKIPSWEENVTKLRIAFGQFEILTNVAFEEIFRQQTMLHHVKSFQTIIHKVQNRVDWEHQLIQSCQYFTCCLTDKILPLHFQLALLSLSDIVLQTQNFNTEYSLLLTLCLQLQILSMNYLTVSYLSSEYAGCLQVATRSHLRRVPSVLKLISNVLKTLEGNKSRGVELHELHHSCNRLLLLFYSLCTFFGCFIQAKRCYQGENSIIGTYKYPKYAVNIALRLFRVGSLLLSLMETWFIQKEDVRCLHLIKECYWILLSCLQVLEEEGLLIDTKHIRWIIRIYSNCLRIVINAMHLMQDDKCVMKDDHDTSRVDNDSLSLTEDKLMVELGTCYYFLYGIRVPFLAEDDLKNNWLMKHASQQTVRSHLNPEICVELFYFVRDDVKEYVKANRRGSLVEVKNILWNFLQSMLCTEEVQFSFDKLYSYVKTCLCDFKDVFLGETEISIETLSSICLPLKRQGQNLLQHLNRCGKSDIDVSEYCSVLLEICDDIFSCTNWELQLARKRYSSPKLDAHFRSRQKLLETLFELVGLSVALEPNNDKHWIGLGEIMMELSHIEIELQHLESVKEEHKSRFSFSYEEAANAFHCGFWLSVLDACEGSVEQQSALQGEGICYYLAARSKDDPSTKVTLWQKSAIALDKFFNLNDGKMNFELLSFRLSNWNVWYLFLLRGKLGYKLRQPVSTILKFLKKAALVQKELGDTEDRLESEPFYQFDMIRLKILLHWDEFHLSEDDIKIIQEDISIWNEKEQVTKGLSSQWLLSVKETIVLVSNQLIRNMHQLMTSKQIRNNDRASGYLYKPVYATAFAYKFGLGDDTKALEEISNLFRPEFADKSNAYFWWMFSASPSCLLGELTFESKARYIYWRFKCLEFYIEESCVLDSLDNLWAVCCRLNKRKAEETDERLQLEVIRSYFHILQRKVVELKNWEKEQLDAELCRLWNLYLMLEKLDSESSVANLLQRLMERLLECIQQKNQSIDTFLPEESVFVYCHRKWSETRKNRKKRRLKRDDKAMTEEMNQSNG